MLISFLTESKRSIKFFSLSSFWLYVKCTPKAFIGSSGHLISKGFALSFLNEPIHMPSVFEQLILSPETISNRFSISNSFTAESVCVCTCFASCKTREGICNVFFPRYVSDSKKIGLESQHPTIDPRTGLRLLRVDKLQGFVIC